MLELVCHICTIYIWSSDTTRTLEEEVSNKVDSKLNYQPVIYKTILKFFGILKGRRLLRANVDTIWGATMYHLS